MRSPLVDDARTLWRLRGLVGVLTRRELVARFAGSAGGVLWAWVQPLLTIASYYLVFDIVFAMRMGENAPTQRVGTYLIVGMMAWTAFADAVQRGMSSLVDAGGILQKNPLPPVLFPTRAVLASALVYAPMLLLLALGYWPLHQGSPAVLAMLPMVLLQIALAWLLGYLLSILMAALRDVAQVVAFMLSVGPFLAPVLFPITLFPEGWRWLLWLNPMTAWVLGYQAVLLKGAWPPAEVGLAMGVWLVVLGLALDVALRRSREQLVDWL